MLACGGGGEGCNASVPCCTSLILFLRLRFAEHINNTLSKDTFLKEGGYIPMDASSSDLFVRISDCIVQAYQRGASRYGWGARLELPHGGKPLNLWERQEDNNVVINSAKSIGCQVINIHAPDLMRAAEDHKEHLVLGLGWQIVKAQLMNKISLKEVPEPVGLRVST